MTVTDTEQLPAAPPAQKGTPPRGRRVRKRADAWVYIGIMLTITLAAIIVLPQLRLLGNAFGDGDGGFTLANFGTFLASNRFVTATFNSVVIALIAGILACAIGVPSAYILATYDIPKRSLMLTLATMATVSPPFLGAYAWVMLLGRGGMLPDGLRRLGIDLPFESIIGPGGIVWVTIWATQSMAFLIAYDAFRAVDPSLDEAAMSVGSTPTRTRFRIIMPLVVPALVTALYTVAMRIFSDFGTPLIVGGGFQMLPVQVYYEFLSEVKTNPALASVASLVMLVIAGSALIVQQWALRRRDYTSVSVRTRPLIPVTGVKRFALTAVLGVIFFISFVPHLVVVLSSFLTWKAGVLSWQFTLDNYVRVFERNLSVVLTSFVLAGIGCVLCILLGVAVAYITVRRRYPIIAPALNAMVMIPYILPGTVLAIGLILTFNTAPLIFTGTATIIVLAYVIRRLPYFMKSIEAALSQVGDSLEEAAMMVGANPIRAFRTVTLPVIRPAIVSGGTVAFLQMITELSATVILFAAPFATMTVVIFNNAMQPGSPFGVSSAMTVILMVSVYVPLYFVRRRFSSIESS